MQISDSIVIIPTYNERENIETVSYTHLDVYKRQHQKFADMQLGHDPNLKFTVGRAIYQGILQFITRQHDKDYVVQPLPVSHFAIRFGKKKNTLEL